MTGNESYIIPATVPPVSLSACVVNALASVLDHEQPPDATVTHSACVKSEHTSPDTGSHGVPPHTSKGPPPHPSPRVEQYAAKSPVQDIEISRRADPSPRPFFVLLSLSVELREDPSNAPKRQDDRDDESEDDRQVRKEHA